MPPSTPVAAVLMTLAVALLAGPATPATVQAEEDPALVVPQARGGEKVDIESLPVPVQRTLRLEGGNDVASATRRIDATGETVYLAHIRDAEGIHQLLLVGEDGLVISREQERRRDNTKDLGSAPDAPASDASTPTSTIPPAGSLAGAPSHSSH